MSRNLRPAACWQLCNAVCPSCSAWAHVGRHSLLTFQSGHVCARDCQGAHHSGSAHLPRGRGVPAWSARYGIRRIRRSPIEHHRPRYLFVHSSVISLSIVCNRNYSPGVVQNSPSHSTMTTGTHGLTPGSCRVSLPPRRLIRACMRTAMSARTTLRLYSLIRLAGPCSSLGGLVRNTAQVHRPLYHTTILLCLRAA